MDDNHLTQTERLRTQLKRKDKRISVLEQEIDSLLAFQTREKALDSADYDYTLAEAAEEEVNLLQDLSRISHQTEEVSRHLEDYDSVQRDYTFDSDLRKLNLSLFQAFLTNTGY